MSDKNIYACSDLAKYAPQFVENGCNDFVSEGLQEDKGLNKSIVGGNHNDCSDLNDINDCYVGTAPALTDGYEDCDWKDYMKDLFTKVYEFNKSIIASICGLWKRVHKIEDMLDGYTFRVYHTVCGKENFADAPIRSSGADGAICYFGQSKKEPGYAIQVPIGTMSSIEAVFAQTKVVGKRTFPATVTIQSYYKQGNYLIVDLDPYEWVSAAFDKNLVPYDLPVDLLILGKK